MVISRAAPLHPILVHFTIGLVGASLGFEIFARIQHSQSLAAAAWWTIATAVPVTSGTVVTGLMSRRRAAVAAGGAAMKYLRIHSVLGPILFGGLIALGVWRASFRAGASPPNGWYLTALGLLVLVMTIQGYLGGELVYEFGLGVRHRYKRLPLHDS